MKVSKENQIIGVVSLIVIILTWIAYGFNAALALFISTNVAVAIKDYFTGGDMEFRIRSYRYREKTFKGFLGFVAVIFCIIWAVSNIYLALFYLLIPISEHITALKGIKNEQTI